MAKYLGVEGLQELIRLLKSYVDEEISEIDLSLFIIVEKLPETGEENKIYLVPVGDPEDLNIYAEYIWLGTSWEKLGDVQIKVDLSDYYTKEETYSKSEVDSYINGLLSHEIDDYSFNATSPLNLSGSYNSSTHVLTITGSIDAASSTQDGYMSSSDKSKLDSLDTSKVVQSVSASGTDPLVLNASVSDGALSITGSVDLTSKQDKLTAGTNVQISDDNIISATDTTYSNATSSSAGLMSATDKSNLDSLVSGSVTSATASGTAPLTLSASVSNNALTISGSVAASSASSAGYMSSEQYTELANLVEDPLQYAEEISTSDVDSYWDAI